MRREGTASSLEVFILEMIRQGITTVYELKNSAGISVGAAIPAVSRLAARKLLTRAAPDPRRELKLTSAGKQVLNSWAPPVRMPTEFDDVLRTTYLLLVLRKDVRAAQDLLASAARARARQAEDRADVIQAVGKQQKLGNAQTYLWMRAVGEQLRFESESHALTQIAKSLTTGNKR